MGCLTVRFTRVGGMTAEAERIGGISCTATRVGGMNVRFALVCKPGIRLPYLEINPTILWVYPDWSAQNDVYSNTHWNVD